MDYLEGATVQKKARIMKDGRIIVRDLQLQNGERKSLAVLLPGEYTFKLGATESIEMLEGELELLVNEAQNGNVYRAGDRFDIPAQIPVVIRVLQTTDYIAHK